MDRTEGTGGRDVEPEAPATDLPVDSVQFCSIEDMQAAAEAEGWKIDYRQIEPGPLTVRTESGLCAGIGLMHVQASRSLEVDGEPPPEHLTVMAPLNGTRMWGNGHMCDRQRLMLLRPGAEMHIVTGSDADVVSMHVPLTLLEDAGIDIRSVKIANDACGLAAVTPGPGVVDGLAWLMRAALYRPASAAFQKKTSTMLMSKLAAAIDGAVDRTSSPTATAIESRRIVRRSREFIEAHLDRPISVGELCRYAAVSLSKLERVFRRALNVTPTQYVLARRLVAVNRELILGYPDGTQVSAVAMDYGFTHLGRFSGAYRRHFGELPRRTLSASPRNDQ